jgi:hypothetical protein
MAPEVLDAVRAAVLGQLPGVTNDPTRKFIEAVPYSLRHAELQLMRVVLADLQKTAL